MYSTFQSVRTMRHLNTGLLYFGAGRSIVRDDKVSWQRLLKLCEKFSPLKNPSDQTCQRKSSHATEIICHPDWKLGEKDRLNRCIYSNFTENKSNKLPASQSISSDMLLWHVIHYLIAVLRQFVAQIDSKMLEAAEDLCQSLLSVNCKLQTCMPINLYNNI